MTWNLGCDASDPQEAYSNWATGISGGTQATKMWLDGCASSGGSFDIEAVANTSVYTFDFIGDAGDATANDGTITSYTP